MTAVARRRYTRLAARLPSPGDYRGARSGWRHDLIAGATVGVVALPLALAFGVATGVGAAAGVTTAIVAGVVAAVFGGSNVQVSGPTGAMTVVLVPLVARHGPGVVAPVAVVAGLIVLVAGLSGVGRVLVYLPWPVIEGFTVGIASIIALQQVPAALGVAKPPGENTVAVAVRAIARGGWSAPAVAITALVAGVMLLVGRRRSTVPASLVAVSLATAVAQVLHLDVARIGALPGGLPAPRLPDFAVIPGLVGPAFAVAALAAIESLLSAKVADGMADVPQHDPHRELVGQGLANVASGLFGGMPATGAIARTAVNVRAGARTRLAATAHSAVLLVVVLAGAFLVAPIPLAALAGVLVVTAARMVERHNVRAALRATRADAAVLLTTAGATLAFDLIVAIEIGIALAALLALRQIVLTTTAIAEPLTAEVDPDDEQRLLDDHILTYRLDGPLFFGAAHRFLTELTQISDVRVVILRLKQVQMLDATGANALGEIVRTLHQRGIVVLIKGASGEHERILRAVGALDVVTGARHCFDDLADAVAHARLHAGRDARAMQAAATGAGLA